jgi:hypothetical protein
MNSAALKFNKITSTKGGFQGSVTTVQEDIVALVSNSAIKRKPTPLPLTTRVLQTCLLHTHPTDTCRTHQKWKEGKSGNTPIAALGQADELDLEDAPANAPPTDITVFLALALNLAGDNDVTPELIAEVLNTVHDI